MPLTASELGDSIKKTFNELDQRIRLLEDSVRRLEVDKKQARHIIRQMLKHAATSLPEKLVREGQAYVHDESEGTGRG